VLKAYRKSRIAEPSPSRCTPSHAKGIISNIRCCGVIYNRSNAYPVAVQPSSVPVGKLFIHRATCSGAVPRMPLRHAPLSYAAGLCCTSVPPATYDGFPDARNRPDDHSAGQPGCLDPPGPPYPHDSRRLSAGGRSEGRSGAQCDIGRCPGRVSKSLRACSP
jgi:hypothetical protein